MGQRARGAERFPGESCACYIVSVPHNILKKEIKLCEQELATVSLDTVKIVADDARPVYESDE